MTDEILLVEIKASEKMADIESDVAMIKHHAEKINGIDLADHAHLRELKRLLDKLGRDGQERVF